MFTVFQARRIGIRYKTEDGARGLVYTLNGSGAVGPDRGGDFGELSACRRERRGAGTPCGRIWGETAWRRAPRCDGRTTMWPSLIKGGVMGGWRCFVGDGFWTVLLARRLDFAADR